MSRKPFDFIAEEAKRAAALFLVKGWKQWNPTTYRLFVWHDVARQQGTFVPNGSTPDGRMTHVGYGVMTFRSAKEAHAFRLQMPAERRALTSIVRTTSEVEIWP